jgi:hypothetical protein
MINEDEIKRIKTFGKKNKKKGGGIRRPGP